MTLTPDSLVAPHPADREVAISETPPPVAGRKRFLRRGAPAGIAVLVLAISAGALNVWWLAQYRAGLAYDIDEAGYLQRALRDGRDISLHGFVGLETVLRRPDIIAPLLPLLSGSLHALLGLTVFNMLQTQAISYAVAIIAAYLLARTFTGRSWSLFVAFLAASLPGLIDAGRVYILAEPAAACFTLTIVALLRVRSFDSLWRASAWGIIFGMTALTRTMILGLLVGVGIAAIIRLFSSGVTKRRLVNFSVGLCLAFVVAWSWYADSWRTVLTYLTTYGYGNEAGTFGRSHTPLGLNWWTVRLRDLVNQDVFFPIVVVLVLSICVLCYRAVRRQRGLGAQGVDGSLLKSHHLGKTCLEFIASDVGIVALILFLGWLVLSTTPNAGSFFELPLAVPLLCVLIAPVGNRFGIGTLVVLLCGLVAGGLTMADQAYLLPQLGRYSSLQVGSISVTSFSGLQVDFPYAKREYAQLGGTYWANCGGATYTCWYGATTGITVRYLKRWDSLTTRVADLAQSVAAGHHRQPVVFVAYQGPLLNTNTIALAAEKEGRTLLMGALRPSVRAHASLQTQLMSPRFGQPNVVLAGAPPKPGQRFRGRGSSVAGLRTVDRLLRRDGFHRVDTIPLPGQQPLAVWWLNR